MNIIVKKTFELSDSEQFEILTLFNVIFNKDRIIVHFRNQFLKTILGYSYHSILYDDNKIVGSFSFIPSYYIIENKQYLATLGVDLMIQKEYQGQGFFFDMFSECINYMRNEGVVFIILFPNDTAYPGYINSKLVQEIGSLTIYALPYRIGGIKPILKTANWLSIVFVNIFLHISLLFANNNKYSFPIAKEMVSYNQIRYKQPDGDYKTEYSKDGGFTYKLMEYEGIKAAFLIDVFEKSSKNFINAVKHIIKNHKKEFDILLYVGYLPFGFHGFMKVPQRFLPKNFHFMGKIIRKDSIDKDLFYNLSNWDINLSNYDLL
jgi:GNAT superfamily N-acetyltransferase